MPTILLKNLFSPQRWNTGIPLFFLIEVKRGSAARRFLSVIVPQAPPFSHLKHVCLFCIYLARDHVVHFHRDDIEQCFCVRGSSNGAPISEILRINLHRQNTPNFVLSVYSNHGYDEVVDSCTLCSVQSNVRCGRADARINQARLLNAFDYFVVEEVGHCIKLQSGCCYSLDRKDRLNNGIPAAVGCRRKQRLAGLGLSRWLRLCGWLCVSDLFRVHPLCGSTVISSPDLSQPQPSCSCFTFRRSVPAHAYLSPGDKYYMDHPCRPSSRLASISYC